MRPRPVTVPPGRCLTDVWAHLNPQQRREMLRVVQSEAEAVSRETAAARIGEWRPAPMDASELAALWQREHDEANARQLALAAEVATYRVGDAMAMRGPWRPVPPARTLTPAGQP